MEFGAEYMRSSGKRGLAAVVRLGRGAPLGGLERFAPRRETHTKAGIVAYEKVYSALAPIGVNSRKLASHPLVSSEPGHELALPASAPLVPLSKKNRRFFLHIVMEAS